MTESVTGSCSSPQLNREGFVNVANAANSHKNIGVVASLFSTQQLLIHSSCTNLLNEIPGYVWDAKAVKRGEDQPVKENDDFCFVPGTLVETQFGPRRIELLEAGDYVHTRKGLRRVKAAGMTSKSAAVYTVHMSDGSTLTGTGGHPVWVDGKGWTRLDALRYADRLEAWKSSGSAPVRVVRVVAEAQRSPVYNLTVEDVPEYFAGGVLVHNCDALRYAVATSQFMWRHALPTLHIPQTLESEAAA